MFNVIYLLLKKRESILKELEKVDDILRQLTRRRPSMAELLKDVDIKSEIISILRTSGKPVSVKDIYEIIINRKSSLKEADSYLLKSNIYSQIELLRKKQNDRILKSKGEKRTVYYEIKAI